ncbi:hypothetical protein YDYSY3_58970 [Paenibacillus chitinolyticus]|uniref:hypothetical protein n=1 Tax=Paenibacillus chitinolyticus TaxID=79263 RepID=UPI0026E4D4D9|nr:hypothetical protein [Paenibacillus chitinolyticus]GKS14897.1 hypothetical protein YDYSY3_58970 [Paenibacillus chitinolyticus]
MKSQLRNITIDSQAFVYWYSGGQSFTLNISPKENKNIKITLIFESNPPDEDPLTSWAFYNITAQKNDLETTIHLGKPKHIAEIISYLMKQRKELFTKGQPHILNNAWDLLMEMGYSNFNPVWVGEW